MEFSYTKSTDTSTNMVTRDYSKSRMRENRTYGSVRGGQSNLIPSTRLRGWWWRLRRKFKKGARLRRRLCRRVVVRFAQGATAPAALKVVVSLWGHSCGPGSNNASPFGGWRHHLPPGGGTMDA